MVIALLCRSLSFDLQCLSLVLKNTKCTRKALVKSIYGFIAVCQSEKVYIQY